MTLIDPREALAEQSSFISYLMGVASLGRIVHAMADGSEARTDADGEADNFVHVLLGVASLGNTIEQFTETDSGAADSDSEPAASVSATARWLR